MKHHQEALEKGDIFRLPVSEAHPTQCSVGMLAVEGKKREIEKVFQEGADALHAYLCKQRHLVPVVIGPEGIAYLTDYHHLSTAVWRADIPASAKAVYAYVIHVWSDLERDEFWSRMIENNLTWLYDDKGEGPIHPALIPDRIERMLNDPFRTLSKWIRECGCYRKNPTDAGHKHLCEEKTYFPESKNEAFFIEFRWANFLRQNITLNTRADFSRMCAAMPYSPAYLQHESKALREAFAEVVKLIGCHQLADARFDHDGFPSFSAIESA